MLKTSGCPASGISSSVQYYIERCFLAWTINLLLYSKLPKNRERREHQHCYRSIACIPPKRSQNEQLIKISVPNKKICHFERAARNGALGARRNLLNNVIDYMYGAKVFSPALASCHRSSRFEMTWILMDILKAITHNSLLTAHQSPFTTPHSP